LAGISVASWAVSAFLLQKASESESEVNVDLYYSLMLFRPSAFCWIFMVFFAVNIHFWAAFGINWPLIFKLDPRKTLNATKMAYISALLCILWSASWLTYLLIGEALRKA